MKTATRKAAKTIEITNKVAAPKAPVAYSGKPIEATKVYRKQMDGFSSKKGNGCKAEAWMLIHEGRNTVTHANTYNDVLKASYNPDHYTYPQKEKVIAAKIDAMIEVDPMEWPTWIISTALAKLSPADKKLVGEEIKRVRRHSKAK
jgi:hypothetical protein